MSWNDIYNGWSPFRSFRKVLISDYSLMTIPLQIVRPCGWPIFLEEHLEESSRISQNRHLQPTVEKAKSLPKKTTSVDMPTLVRWKELIPSVLQ
jgi:hypothetical protein